MNIAERTALAESYYTEFVSSVYLETLVDPVATAIDGEPWVLLDESLNSGGLAGMYLATLTVRGEA